MSAQLGRLNFIGVGLLSVFVVSGCSDSFMKAAPRSKTTALVSLATEVDAAGNVTGTFDPNSGNVQVMKLTSGTLAGSAIAIPPGSLSVPVSVTVGEGETLASSTFTQQLGITANQITAAGPSVSFIPSTNVQATTPFTLSIPLTTTALALDSNPENLVVMYRAMKVANGETTYEMGVIPGDQVVISNNKVSFQTTRFGVFQLGKSETKITEQVSKPTVEPPVLKQEVSNPLVGTWGMYRVGSDSHGETGSGGDGGITWANDPIEFRRIDAGQFSFEGTPFRGIRLEWNGGGGPFVVKRSSDSAFPDAATTTFNSNTSLFNDPGIPKNLPTVYYRITNSSGTASVDLPVTIPTFIEWDAMSVDAVGLTIKWISNGTNFQVYDWPNEDCTGTATMPSDSNSALPAFQIPWLNSTPFKYITVKDTATGVSSTCLTAKRPQSLQVSQIKVSSSSVDLSWFGPGTGTFTVERHSSLNCSDTMPAASTSPSTYTTITGLTAGSAMSFRIRDSAGNYSGCAPVHLPGSAMSITLNHVQINLPTSTNTSPSVALSWTMISGSTYTVKRFEDPACSSTSPTTVASGLNATTIADNYPVLNQIRYYRVEAATFLSTCFPVFMRASESISINLVQQTDLPPSTEKKISLSWSDLGTNTYVVERFDTMDCTGTSQVLTASAINTTTFTDPMMFSPGTEKFYRIRSETGLYLSACQRVKYTPSAPRWISASANETSVALNWSMGAAGTLEYFEEAGCTTPKSSLTTTAGQVNAMISGLTNGHTYSFRMNTFLPCIDITTADAVPSFIINSAGGAINFNLNTKLRVNADKPYKLTLYSYKGNTQYTFDSDDLPAGDTGNTNTTIGISITATDAANVTNAGLSIRPSAGCYLYLDAMGRHDIRLTTENTSVSGSSYTVSPGDLTVVCDGQSNDQPGGKDDFAFGLIPDGSPYSIMEFAKISRSDFIHGKMFFASSDCTGLLMSEFIEKGVYSLPAVDVAGTIPIDLTFKDISGTIKTDKGVAYANEDPTNFGCGISDWVINVSRSLSGTVCEKDSGVGTTEYHRFKIDGDRFYPCGMDTGDWGKTPETRVPDCSGVSSDKGLQRQK